MLAQSLHLLVVSEDPEDKELLRQLAAEGLHGTTVAVDAVTSIGHALSTIEEGGYDLLIFNERIGGMSGLALLRAAKRTPADTPVVLLTEGGDDETAVAAIRGGAADYLVKSRLTSDLLRNSLRHAFERRDAERLQRQAEQALRESERRYRLLLEHASDGIFMCDREGRIQGVNTRICEMLGYAREELLGMNAHDIIAAADPQSDNAGLLELPEGESVLRERLYRRKDGRAVPVEVSARAIENDGYQAIVRDITERKRAEDELRRSEERFRIVARATNDTVWDWDLESDTIWINEGMQLQFRYAPDEVGSSGAWWNERIHPADRQRVLAGLRQALEGGEQFWWDEYRFQRGDNSYASIFDRAYIVRDDSGKAVRVMGAMMDVTERQLAEEALRASEEQYRALFDTNPLPLWVMEPETLRFLAVNQAAVQHYGYSQERFFDMSLEDLLPPGEPRDLAELKRQVWARQSAVRHVRGDGSTIEVELTANRLLFRGRPALLLLANDVTERLRAEQSLRQNEEQLRQWQKIEAVGRLAGGIAHDFSNMINVISGYGQLLYRRVDGDETARHNVDEILKASDRAATLTRQLLTFSRKQRSQQQIVQINDVVEGMGGMLRRLIGEDVELRFSCAPGLRCIKSDRGQLEQVIMNLVVNGRDAMPQGGQIVIQTASVELDDAYARTHVGVAAGPHILLSVRDEGTGMDAEVLAHLFEPFFTTKGPGKGTGLGLATVYGIVKQSSGHIAVESVTGAGTTFRLYFPAVAEASCDEAAQTCGVALQEGSERVLVVEDEDVVRNFVSNSLRSLGYRVFEASCGPEALLLCEQHTEPIDLLLTDIVMPKMHGTELAERLLARIPGLRVLYMSGYAAEVSPGDGTSLLEKPFTTPQLSDAIRRLLSRSSSPGATTLPTGS